MGSLVNPTPSLGTSTANAPQLSRARSMCCAPRSRRAGTRRSASMEAKDLVVVLRFGLNRDGSVAAEPIVTNRGSNPLFQVAVGQREASGPEMSAVPPAGAKYDPWNDVEVKFDPAEMFRGG